MNEKSPQNQQSTNGLNTVSFYLGLTVLLVGIGGVIYWGYFKILIALILSFTLVTCVTKFNSGAPWSLYGGHFRFAMVVLGGFVGIGSIAGVAIGSIFFMIYLMSG